MRLVNDDRWFERKILSNLDSVGLRRMFDQVKDRPLSCFFCRSRSLIRSLNGIMEWVLGFVEEESLGLRIMLKSPKIIQVRSCRHAMVLISFRNCALRLFCVGP
jgi:hypothetical protein